MGINMEKKLIVNSKYKLSYDYYVTDTGEIWSSVTKKFLKQQKDKNGYMKVRLCSENNERHRYSVHRLVLENFRPIENMEEMQVNHIDGNKENNSLSNLEWVTCKDNIKHAVENNLRAEINGAAKLTKEQVIDIYIRSKKGESNKILSKEYGVHPDTIGRIKNQKLWKKVTSEIIL